MSSKPVEAALLPFKLFAVLSNLAWASLTAPLLSTSPTYLEHIGNAGVRAFLGGLSPTQLQMLIPSFLDAYRSYCTSKGIEALIVPIPNTTVSGFWIGDPRKAKYFSLYVHGGGYVIPGSPQHITMLEKFVKWSNNNLAIFCVAYTLSPEAVYPTALAQCVEGLRYMFSLPQINAKNTLLTGDSAGGAVVLALLSHMSSHPHPNSEIVKRLSLGDDERIKAAIIINPFISSDGTRYASIKRFGTRDTFNEAAANAWMTTYNGGKSGYDKDMYICPAHADASFWKGTKCEKILCTAGGEEILQDAILDWAEKCRSGMTEGESNRKGKHEVVKVVVGEKETHILPILSPREEGKLDELGEKSTEGALRAFIKANLAS